VIAYSPGEVFPFTEIGGPIDAATMPFPTNCYNPITSDFGCGPALPMTPNVAADMPGSFRFMAGLGEDMIGYLFPPGNFVGSQGETLEPPWVTYETATGSDHDRFGHGHADDAESVGPWAGLAMTQALDALLVPQLGSRPTVVPGLFVDGQGRFSLSPFASHGFSGAVGIETVDPDGTRHVLRGPWATYLSTPDAGTAGTALPYSVATRGVFVGGKAVLVDTFSGARALGF
jgi:hypothetical protein